MDIGASNWSETDANNTTAAPDGAPEGMAPSGVNDVLRAHQGAVKRFYDWQSVKTTAGSATAFTLTYDVAPGALVDGMVHLVNFHAANGAAATLNVNSLGAIPLHTFGMSAGAPAWVAAPANTIGNGSESYVAYHSSSGAYRVLNPAGGGAWTPSDTSGASLSFTSVSAAFRVTNNLVHAYFTLTYPTTSNGSSAVLGGLPVTIPNLTHVQNPAFLDTHGTASGGFLRPVQNTTTAVIVNASGGQATNANMSGLTISACLIYPAS